jgi:hypothetical protein
MSGILTTGKLVLTNTLSNQDAFDRLRVSMPETLIDIMYTVGKNNFQLDELVIGAGATALVNNTNSYLQMSLDSGATGKVVSQSYEYVPYQPGKSRLMIFSGVLDVINGGTTGLISRIGSFDSSVEKTFAAGNGNGLFFELNNKTLSACVRLNNADTSVPLNLWNYDKFDGTGPSGLSGLNFATTKVFAIDQEWLGVGRVRFGFFINGAFQLGHSFNHSGIGTPTSTAITVPYTKTGKMPVRAEIVSSLPVSAEMRMIAATIMSEGGLEPNGLNFSVGQRVGIVVGATLRPLISLKIRESEPYNRKTIALKAISLLNTTNRGMQWDLYMSLSDSVLTGAGFTNVDTTNSIAQYDISATGITTINSVLIDSGYSDISSNITFNYDKYLASPIINSSLSGKSKVLSLCGMALGASPTNYGSLTWVEII